MKSAPYIFIGNENDERTKQWGIEKGAYYNVKFNEESFQAHIQVGVRWITCPYGSRKAFFQNWKLAEEPKRVIIGIDWGYTKPKEKKKRFVLVDSLNKKSIIQRVKAINRYIKRPFHE